MATERRAIRSPRSDDVSDPVVDSNSRHPGDAVRIVLGAMGLGISLLAVQRDRLTTFETDLFHLVNNLPSGLSAVLGALMQLGNVVAAPAIGLAVLVLARRRWRMAVDVTLAGLIAWFAAKAVKSAVERPRPGGLIDDVNRIATTEGLGFVSGHTAVAAAIVTASAPYLPRRVRRAAWMLPWIVGGARIFYGAHLPLDIVGGAALGWAIGAGLHLALGAPHRVPSLAEAASVLRRAGNTVESVERVAVDAKGSFPFVATVGGHRTFIKLLDPEPRDRDWIYRAARFLAFRDVRDEAGVTDADTQAHREAAMTLLARCRGVRVPNVRGIHRHGGRVWVVEEHIDAVPLDRLAEVDDAVLASLWEQLRLLRDAGIAHRDLVASNLLVDRAGDVWVVDFAHAKSSTRGRALDDDVAELLATTAAIVGVERAVDACQRTLGIAVLARSLPALQPFVLSAETRALLRRQPTLLGELRDRVAAQTRPTVAPPLPLRSGDVRLRRLAVAVSSLGSAAALVAVAGFGDVVDVLSTPGYRWLGVAVLAVAAATIADAASVLASVDRRAGIGRTSLAVLRDRADDALTTTRRDHVSLLWHLIRSGVPWAEADVAVRRWVATRSVFIIVGLALTVPAAIAAEVATDTPDHAGPLVAIAAAALAIEILVLVRQLRSGPAAVPDVGHTPVPVRATTLLLAATVALAAPVVATVAVVDAMGTSLVAGPAMVAVAVVGIGRLVPLASASGLATAVLALGLAAVGVPVEVAVTAAIVARLLQAWVPILVGVLVRTPPWDR